MKSAPPIENSVGHSLNRYVIAVGFVVLVLVLVVVYNSIVSNTALETTDNLSRSVERLARGESRQFLKAEQSVRRLKTELLSRLNTLDPEQSEQRFTEYFAQGEDGAWRVSLDPNLYNTLPALQLAIDAAIPPSARMRAVASFELLREQGSALVPPYHSLSIDFVEQGLTVSYPYENQGVRAARSTQNEFGEETYWTHVYFDEAANTWVASVIEPLEWQGERVGTLRQDVDVGALLDAMMTERFPGAYSLLINGAGQLILHPDFLQQIQDSKGDLALVNLEEPTLTRINEFARNASQFPVVIEDSATANFYGIAKLSGPQWYLVTVYPREVIEQQALATLLMPGIISVIVLILGILTLHLIVKRMILQPLGHLDSAVRLFGESGQIGPIPMNADNEFGRLARSFENLSQSLDDRAKSLLEAEKDWQRTFNTIPELIAILDPELSIKQANESFLNRYGLYLNNVKGASRSAFLGDNERLVYEDSYHNLLQTREVQIFQIYSTKLAASFDITLAPLLSDTSEILGIVEVARDVTENRKLEDQLRQSQKMDAIGQLAGGIAHDFNNLLQVIFGYADTILDERTKANGDVQAVNQVLSAATKASALTGQLLAFGRRQVMRAQPEDLGKVIGSTLVMIERLIEENIQVNFTPASEPLIVLTDANQLEQVVLNLCVNARDAMPDGGELNISVTRALAENIPESLPENVNGYAHICVKDTGHGIDSHVIENIFEPFFTTKDRHKGTGLGLATAYGIVQQHGGAIQVASPPKGGAQFCIYLPLIEEEVELASYDPASHGTHTGDECVLIAEDDEIIRGMLVMMLTNAGYKVLTAVNGSEALEVFEVNKDEIALMVLDVMMPELSGHRVMQMVRSEKPGLPCLFASGYSEDQLSEDLLSEGHTGFITKPFRRNTLLREVRLLLDHQTSGKSDQN